MEGPGFEPCWPEMSFLEGTSDVLHPSLFFVWHVHLTAVNPFKSYITVPIGSLCRLRYKILKSPLSPELHLQHQQSSLWLSADVDGAALDCRWQHIKKLSTVLWGLFCSTHGRPSGSSTVRHWIIHKFSPVCFLMGHFWIFEVENTRRNLNYLISCEVAH